MASTFGNNQMASRLWPLTKGTNRILEEYTNYDCILAFTINKDVLRKGARTFGDFKKDSNAVGESWETLFQSFLKLGEDLADKTYKQKHRLPKNVDFTPMHFFLESIYAPTENKDDKKEIIAYTFWLLIMKLPEIEGEETIEEEDEMSDVEQQYPQNVQLPQENKPAPKFKLNANKRWKWIVESNSRGQAKQDKTTNGSNRDIYYDGNKARDWQKWKKLDGKSLLSTYFDMNMGYTLSAEFKEQLYVRDLSSEQHLFSATKMFNIAAAFANRGNRSTNLNNVNETQNMESFFNYFPNLSPQDLEDPNQFARSIREYGIGGGVFKFPDTRYVMNIPLSDLTVKNISRKLLPEKQQTENLGAASAIPRIVFDFQKTYSKDFDFSLDDLMSDMMKVSLRLNDGESPRDIEMNNIEIETPEEKLRNSMALIMVASGLEKVLKDLQSTSITSLDPVNQQIGMSLNRKTPEFNPEFIKRAAGHIEDSSIDESMSFNVDSYISEYAELRENGMKNLAGIDELKNQVGNQTSLNSFQVICRKMMLLIQKDRINKYNDRCRSLDSNVSPYEKANIRAIEKGVLKGLIKPTEKLSVGLTVGGTLELKEYIQNARVFLAKRPRELSLLTQYCMSVWSLNLNRCRLNMFMMGPGDASKSWCLEATSERMNEGTVESESYRSEKGEATVERNRNGVVIIWHELDPNMLMTDKTGTSMKAGLFKNRTTSNVMEVRRLVKDSDGKFVTQVTRCEMSAVFLGAANFNLRTKAEEAIQTRVHIVPIECGTFEYSVLGLNFLDEIRTTNDRNVKNQLIEVYKKVQVMFMEIERLVYIGGLNDVTILIPLFVLCRVEKAFKDNHIPPPTYRTFDRTIQLSRLKCIRNCIEMLFHTKGARFEGMDVESWMYAYLDRPLFVTFENVVAAIGEQIDMYVDYWENIVKKALSSWYNEGTQFSMKTQKHMREVDQIGGGYNSSGRDGNANVNYNYVSFTTRGPIRISDPALLHRVAKAIKTLTDGLPDVDFHPSEDTIFNVLDKWYKTAFHSKKYTLKDADLKNNIHEEIIIIEESTPAPVSFIRVEGGVVNFHYSLISNDCTVDTQQIIVNVLEEIGNSKNQPLRVMPFNCDSKYNFVRNIIQTEAKPGSSVIHVQSDIQIDNFSKRVLGGVANSFTSVYIETDIDLWALNERNKKLYITDLPIDDNYLKINIFKNIHADKDNSYDDYGYFLGEKITANILNDNFKPTAFQVQNFYLDLDSKYDSVENCILEEGKNYKDADLDEEYWKINGVYFWDIVGLSKSFWKLYCWTPFWFNMFLNYKVYRFNPPEEFDFETFKKEIDNEMNRVQKCVDERYFKENIPIPNDLLESNAILDSRYYDESTNTWIQKDDVFDYAHLGKVLITKMLGENAIEKRAHTFEEENQKKRRLNACKTSNYPPHEPLVQIHAELISENTINEEFHDPVPDSDDSSDDESTGHWSRFEYDMDI